VEISKDYDYNYDCGFGYRRDDHRVDCYVQEENDFCFCPYLRQDEQGDDHPLLEADLLLLGEGNLALFSAVDLYERVGLIQ
jgi:hypothetical protein